MLVTETYDRPLIVQSDRTILLEVAHPEYEQARDELARFAELVKSPEHIHTYRLSAISLWNAAAAGCTAAGVIATLQGQGRYELPEAIRQYVLEQMRRYGLLRLERQGETLLLRSDEPELLAQLAGRREVQPYLRGRVAAGVYEVDPAWRGHLKQSLIKHDFPVEDLAGYAPGEPLELALTEALSTGEPSRLRAYQQEAAEVFHAGGGPRGGSGVIVLPCGAGKTFVGMAVMAQVRAATLVVTTSVMAVKQWRRELLERTTIRPEDIGEYTGEAKDVRPVTLATYQIITHRRRKEEEFTHLAVFRQRAWGLVIYDEVHLLPAPVFRVTAELQALRRLGLTATLVREDGREDDVFSLIGPKRYDVPWRVLERQGWIATAECTELRVEVAGALHLAMAAADGRGRHRLASENPAKLPLARALVECHAGEKILIIGQYLDQLHELQRELGAPLITGQTAQGRRQELYGAFRDGDLDLLILSKVGNFALDLPDASVAIQVSGTFGSRQEEAQRLGRILRPKRDGRPARFYTLVSRDTVEQEFAQNRQLFLTEQGYRYTIQEGGRFLDPIEEGDIP